MKIILYAMEEIAFATLKDFAYSGFRMTGYGSLDRRYWFVFGHLDILTVPTTREPFFPENEDAFHYLMIKAQTSVRLLALSQAFEQHVKTTNTGIEAEGLGTGDMVSRVGEYIEKKWSSPERVIMTV